MRKCFKYIPLAIIALSTVLATDVQAQPFGNEWINHQQTYYKFKVAEDGVYRIENATLQALGWANVPGAQITLYREGQEIPIYVSNNGSWTNQDYLLFYGTKATGAQDVELYRNSNRHGNDQISIINDSATYFLSYSPGVHERLLMNANSSPANPPAAQPFLTTKVIPSENIRARFSEGESYYTSTLYYYTYHSGKYDKGEGNYWDNNNGASNLVFNLPHIYNGGPNPKLTNSVQYYGKQNGRMVQVKLNGTILTSQIMNAFDMLKSEVSLNHAMLTANTNVEYTVVNGMARVLRSEISYNRTYNFYDVPSLRFEVPTTGQPQMLQFSNLNSSAQNFVVDHSLKQIYILGNGSQVWLGASSGTRSLAFDRESSTVSNLTPVTFKDFTQAVNHGDYLLLADKALATIPNGSLAAYKAYRSSAAGGGHNVSIVSAQDLYDQFGYGIDYHPMGIKRFIKYLQATSAILVKPEHLFIVGKGLSYNHLNLYISNPQTYNFPIVPTFGSPGSDNLFAERDSNNVPSVAVGRLSAFNDAEIQIYLEKVKKYEAAQQTPAVPNLENTLWKKRTLHIAGSQGSSEQLIFLNTLGQAETVIADTLTGHLVTTAGKTTSSVIENATAQIDSLIKDGVQFINFFGHASSSGFDYNLNDPNGLPSAPHFPIFLAYGCDVARIFEPTTNKTISENYLHSENGGSVAMLACTNLGWTGYLSNYMVNLNRKIAQTDYGKTFGIQLNKNLENLQMGFTGVFTDIHSHYMLLLGVPGLKIYSPELPDYYVDLSLVSTIPAVVNTTIDSFEIVAKVFNLGKALSQNVSVKLKKTKAGSSVVLYTDSLNLVLNHTDTIHFKVPIDAVADVGLFNYSLELNESQEFNEISFANNKANIQLYISENNLRPIVPEEFAIVHEQGVTLKASTLNPFIGNAHFLFEIDTTEYFTSSFKQQYRVQSLGGVIKWQVPFQMTDSTVYYWRTTIDSQYNGSYQWNSSSFIYLANGSKGWNQSHFFQFKKDYSPYISLQEPNRRFEGLSYFKNVRVQARDFEFGGENDIYINNERMSFGTCLPWNGILFMVINPVTGQALHDWGAVPGGYTACDAARVYAVEFPLGSSSYRNHAINFLNNIPDNHYLIVKSNNWNGVEFQTAASWMMDDPGGTNTLYHKLLEFGIDMQNLTSRASYAAIGQKNNPNFTANVVIGATAENMVSLDANIPLEMPGGVWSSTLLGPASKWNTMKWSDVISNVDSGNDISNVSVFGFSSAEAINGDSLFTLSSYDTSLAHISASQYPFIQLRWNASDSTKVTLPQLKYWRVMFDPLPEAALNPNVRLVHKDTLTQGEEVNFKVAIENLKDNPMDSMLVRFRLIDNSNVSRIIGEKKFKPLGAFDTLEASITPFNSAAYVGKNLIFVEANPDNNQPEQYHHNNLGYIPFFVKGDAYAPVMDVTFDGVHILNKDIVSAKPLINILIKDENVHYLMNDTANVDVYLMDEQSKSEQKINFDGAVCRFVPAVSGSNKNEARVEYRPTLADGLYTLKVKAKDKVGNNSGGNVAQKFEITFEVVNKSTITNVLNYPNPFSTSTQFIFTLTGAEIPSQFKIQILSVTGKVVKEITKAELGNIRIGRNMTEYRWNGTDQFGQLLGNGVYLYRVITTNATGEQIERRANSAVDKFFKNDYGKLYIMR